ncbi:spermidine/putrescine ABC transporter permease/substrate-binding protein [Spiroplasma culicicola]|uniref:Spermidine/putrescine ABC transporter permease n=1 Tax=Spiroplasma culicicola AES-1 TaxID=1276246 RepID=W6A670_9MOLU|nr:spermidine/putrescine ABC transporter permease/substrate-binding protein [Spiroplasma culicicola]AHI52492.1 spermidine/putrescine ABC transporter permease [Spiroplasma culicicola AES-1]
MKKFFKSSYFVIIMLFIYVPIAVMIFFSFNKGSNLSEWQGFSLKWYEYFLGYSPFIKSIIVSLFVAMVSTIISLVIGVMAVVGLAKCKKRVANNWVRVANIPLVNADVITAVGLMLLFIFSGMRFGIVSLIAAHVSFNVPYVIVTVLPFMMRIDKNLLEASNDLGSTPTKTFFKVILPILTPCIITAAAICFAMSFDDFIISYFTGGDQTNVSTFIYTAKRMQPYINAFGTLLVAVIVFVILVWNIAQITIQRVALNKELIKKGDYKIKQRNALQNRIDYLQSCIDNEVKIRKSRNLLKWFKYWSLQLQIKRLNNKNNNAKISKLEWKKALLTDEIKAEKRVSTIHVKLVEKRTQIEQKIAKTTNDKKIKKLNIVISKLDKKIDKYQSELDWMAQRDEIAKDRAQDVQAQIDELRIQFEALDKSDIKNKTWYTKKIAKLIIKRDGFIEGKNNLKLRLTIEKLAEIKAKNERIANEKYLQLKEQEVKVMKKVSIVEAVDKKITILGLNKDQNLNFDQELSILTEQKQENLIAVKTKLLATIEAKKAKLDEIFGDIKRKQAKYFPDVLAEDYVPSRNRWLKRNWKQVSMGTLLLASFSLITTAYVLNNIYDLVIGNWGSYINPDVLSGFEKEYGVKINYQQYDSNESLYNKNYTFNYDIMVPSEYMVQKMAEENLLQEIMWECVTSIELNSEDTSREDKTCSLDLGQEQNDEVKNDESEDVPTNKMNESLQKSMEGIEIKTGSDIKNALDYSIPYFWGDVRIVFNVATGNKEMLQWLKDEEILEQDGNTNDGSEAWGYTVNEEKLSWDILWQASQRGYNLALNEDPKNVFMYAFEKLYGTVQPENTAQITEAAKEIKTLLSPKNVGIYGDQLIDKVATGNYDIAVMYNGDAIWALSEEYTPEDEEDEELIRAKRNEWTLNGVIGVPGKELENSSNKTESTNIWSDNLVINKTNRNLKLTYQFINYIYTHDNQILQVDETGMSSSRDSVINEILDSIDTEEPYFGSNLITSWYKPTENGQSFEFNEALDNYLVDEFNKIISTKN